MVHHHSTFRHIFRRFDSIELMNIGFWSSEMWHCVAGRSGSQHCEVTYCCQPWPSKLKAQCSIATSGTRDLATWHHIPEDLNPLWEGMFVDLHFEWWVFIDPPTYKEDKKNTYTSVSLSKYGRVFIFYHWLYRSHEESWKELFYRPDFCCEAVIIWSVLAKDFLSIAVRFNELMKAIF